MGVLAGLGPVILLVGIGLVVMTALTSRQIAKDEFERRTDGGTLSYETFKDHERAVGRKRRNGLLKNLAIILTLSGLLLTFAAPALLNAQKFDDVGALRARAANQCQQGDAEACQLADEYRGCVQGFRGDCDDAAEIERRRGN